MGTCAITMSTLTSPRPPLERLIRSLEVVGLTPKEARAYLAAVSFGTASMAELARRSGLKRPTTYLVVDELRKKGLLVPIPKGKRTVYRAETPRGLLQALDERRSSLAGVLPVLEQLYGKTARRPRLRFYEGRRELTRTYDEIFRSKEVRAIFSVDRYLEMFSEAHVRHLMRLLARAGGTVYDLVDNTLKARQYIQRTAKTGVYEGRLLPSGLDLATDILVSGNTVAIFSFDEETAVLIESPAVARTFREIHKLLWGHLALRGE